MKRPGREPSDSPTSTPVLRLRELTLAGFGVYRKPTHFLFPEGNAIYFGPNETGKSTLVFGLGAVWFGLPSTSDGSRIGTGRFRSFGRTDAFFGELVWESDGRLYRLHRDFETHKVRLTEESTGQIELLFDGEHNPLGRSSAGSAFPPVLSVLLGFASWDLFLETFCLSQPLPEGDRLGSELQHLLSGSQDAHIDQIRERIFTRIKALTRGTGELGLARPGGIRPTNQRDPGRIEDLEMRAAKIRLDVEHGRIQLERLNEGNDAIEQAQAEQQEVQQRREERRRRCATLGSWTERQQERMRRSAAVQLLRNAAAAIRETAQEHSVLTAQLARDLDGLGSIPPDVEAKLERLERAAREHARLQEATATLDSERRALEEQQSALAAQLQELADVRGRTDWSQLHASLSRAVARRGALERDLAEMRSRLQAAALPMTEPMSIEACRVRALHYLEAISRLEGIEARSSEIRAQLEERGYLQANGRSDLLQEKFRLESELKECSSALREGRVRAESIARNRLPLDPSAGLGLKSRSRRGARSQWIATLGCAALASGICLGIGLSLLVTVLVSIGSAAVLFAVVRVSHRAAGTELPGPAVPINPGTDPASSVDAMQASDEVERQALARLRATQRKLEDRLQTISLELGPYANSTSSELARMEGRWQALDAESLVLATELRSIRPRLAVPSESDLPWRETDLPPEMMPLLELPGAPRARSHGAMVDWLRGLDDEGWQTFLAQEQVRRDSAREWTSLEDRIAARIAELDDRSEIDLLETRLLPFTLKDDPDLLARRANEAARLERQVDLLEARLSESASTRSAETPTVLSECWRDLVESWPAARASAPWTPDSEPDRVPHTTRPENQLAEWAEQIRKRLREAAPLGARIDALKESESKILGTENCASRTELEQRLAAEESALGVVVREMETLVRDEVLLNAAEEADPADRARSLDALLTRERSAEEADRALEEALEQRIRNLHRKQAGLEGEETPNVAALEIEARNLDEELHEARRERDALAMAYLWMDEALQAYQQSHRAHLADRITMHFQTLTGVARRIVLDERFEISVLEPSGDPLRVDQLSQGARDQLLLAMRFGVADLLSASIPLPFFFDDPFVHFDAQRLELVREALNRLGRHRPWVLLTHRAELADWADPVFIEESGRPLGETVAARISTLD